MWNPLDGLSTVNVAFRKSHPYAVVPSYANEAAAGADLRSVEGCILPPRNGDVWKIFTGIHIQLPPGFEAQIRPRSGLAAKHGIQVVNSPGTIDSDYRGEIVVLLMNEGSESFQVMPGDRIAQLVVVPVFRANFEEVQELGETTRGEGGFGSTGR